MRKTENELQYFKEMQLSDNEKKKIISSMAESAEKREFLSSTSKWKLSPDEVFVTCLNDNNDKIGKPINNYLNIFFVLG